MWNNSEDYELALRLQKAFNYEGIAENSGTQDMDDHSLALHLQDQLNNSKDSSEIYKNRKHDCKESIENMSLVDPKWELIDPNPDVRTLFLQFNDKFFWGRLSCVEVRWSPRMTLCAGVCVYEGRGGLCSVRLSTPLLKLRPRKDLIETLLHEMIHAYLFVTDNNKDHDGHGPEFHKHMYRINKETGTNISVYHNFHDEVDSYRQHWWRCDGPCRSKPPYFGYVKRAMNRAPTARDPWWPAHQQSCGGTYTKVKEPEGYGEKKKKKDQQMKKDESQKNNAIDIRTMFGKSNNEENSREIVKDSKKEQEKNDRIKNNNPKRKGANIAGFARGDSGSLQVYKEKDQSEKANESPFQSKGVNINGFVRGDSENGLEVYNHKSNSVKKASDSGFFNGTGKTIGGNESTSSSKIIRKIPGIGVIETEINRINTQKVQTSISSVHVDSDSDDPETLIFSPTQKVRNKNVNDSKITQQPVLDLSDSDSDFDALLKRLPKGKSSSKNKAKKSLSPGNTQCLDKFIVKGDSNNPVKSVPGFRSVSSKNSQISNASGKAKVTKLPGSAGCAGSSSSKKETTIDFTSERNKRAHCLDTSESDDSELDHLEKQSIKSLFKKQRCQSPIKELTKTSSESQKNSRTGYGSETSGISQQDMVSCPVCQTKVDSNLINIHLDTCLS